LGDKKERTYFGPSAATKLMEPANRGSNYHYKHCFMAIMQNDLREPVLAVKN